MGLIERDAQGRLDGLCAARLVWTGIVDLDPKGVTFDGYEHHFPELTVDKGTASLWGLSRTEIGQVASDIHDLLVVLEHDHALRLDPDTLSPTIRDLVPEGPVTAASVFLLQASSHPLALEKTAAHAVTVRYDEALSRGIPSFADVISRLVWDLRGTTEVSGAFRLTFELLMRRVGALPEIVEAVEGADTHFDSERDVFLEPQINDRFLADVPSRETGTESEEVSVTCWEVLQPFEHIVSLEQAQLAAQETLPTVERHIRDLEAKEERLAASAPDSRDPIYQVPDYEKTFKSNTKAARTFLARSSISILIGLALILYGRHLVFDASAISDKAVIMIAEGIGSLLDAVDLFVGNVDALGTAHSVAGGPVEQACRFLGIFLMVLGIIIPTRRIMKLRRKIARERAWLKNNTTLTTTLVAHREEEISQAFGQATRSWQAELKATEDDLKAVRATKEELEAVITEMEGALARAYEASGLPVRYQNLSAAATVYDYLNQGRAKDMESALELLDAEDASGIVSSEPTHATAAQPTLVACVTNAQAIGERVRRRSSWKVAEGDIRVLMQDASHLAGQ